MKYLTACKKEDVYLVKIDFEGEIGEKWATTTEAVVNFAKKTFKQDEKVNVTFEEKDGQYTVSRITKIFQSTKKKETKAKYACEDCGIELKDGRYKKCYKCSQKSSNKKTQAVQDSIKRQAIGHMTSRTLIALQGHVDPNTITDLMKTIYQIYVELVG